MKKPTSKQAIAALKRAEAVKIDLFKLAQLKSIHKIIDDDLFDLELAKATKKRIPGLTRLLLGGRKRLNRLIGRLADKRPGELELTVSIANARDKKLKFKYQDAMAFNPPAPKLAANAIDLAGLIVEIPKQKNRLPILPDIAVAKRFPLLPWRFNEWRIWEGLIPLLRCLAIPAKATRVEIPVPGSPAMVKVSRDCARAYVINNQGVGSVINVITENVDATFQVAANPSPARPYPPGIAANPQISPFIKGGLNQKYKRLYVPASFYQGDGTGGFYVCVVDVNPVSTTYLDTIAWIDCGWLPEQVSFSDDGETGVIANYMEGTTTIFRVSDHTPLDEVALFTGAGVDQLNPSLPGTNGTFARSIVTTTLPGKGNVALASLTNTTGFPGFSVVELDSPGHPRTNITRAGFGFIDGIAVSPQKDKVLLVDNTSKNLHVYNIVGDTFVFDQSAALPTTGSRVYMGGIAVRPTGNLVFLGTGRSTTSGIGALTCVNYVSGSAVDLPDNLPNGTWDLVIRSFGSPLKPYIFVVSTSGFLNIIPC